jgi:hypothetical protein
LIKYIQINKATDSDWFNITSSKDGIHWLASRPCSRQWRACLFIATTVIFRIMREVRVLSHAQVWQVLVRSRADQIRIRL